MAALLTFEFRIILTTFTVWDFHRLNQKKDEKCRHENIDDSRWEEFANMGSESPLFRFAHLIGLVYYAADFTFPRYPL